jgi:hypothetical protein
MPLRRLCGTVAPSWDAVAPFMRHRCAFLGHRCAFLGHRCAFLGHRCAFLGCRCAVYAKFARAMAEVFAKSFFIAKILCTYAMNYLH